MIKQLLDTIGPWSSMRWQDTSPEGILRIWPGKALHWELTTLLGADWYVVPQQVHTDYTYNAVLRHPGKEEILRKYTTGVVLPLEIPFDNYDLVIALDPILRFPVRTGTLFAYFAAEHWDRCYLASQNRPLGHADLFLDHMLDARAHLSRLPQAISFPYLRDPRTMRSLFATAQRLDAVWVDWRTFATLSGSPNANSETATRKTADRLQEALALPVAFRSFSWGLYHGEDPPRWGDTADYLRELGRQKYYACLGRAGGAGQGLADAASLGCVCFGEKDKPYHRLICHPETLCGDLQEFPRRVRKVCAAPNLQQEILAWQDEKLRRHFIDAPLALIEDALRTKRSLVERSARRAVRTEDRAERAAP